MYKKVLLKTERPCITSRRQNNNLAACAGEDHSISAGTDDQMHYSSRLQPSTTANLCRAPLKPQQHNTSTKQHNPH